MNKLMIPAMLAALSVVAGCASTGASGGGTAAAAKSGGAAACAGNWKIEFDTPMGQQTMTLNLTQSGAKVTGKASDPMGGADNEISGTCEGDALALAQTVQSPMGPLDVKFTGKTSGNSMSGNVALGPLGESPFVGTKQ